jgi:hypothetical protein
MRRVIALAAVAVATLGVVVAADSPGAGAARQVQPPTQITVVRPVNAAGVARSNYTVQAEPTGTVDCSFADPAPSAVSPNIEQCFPDAEYAAACWDAAAPHKVLCMRNPRARKLVRIPRLGAFAPTGLAPASQRAPLAMVLANGDFCSFRIGGTRPSRVGHPHWFVSYDCNGSKFLWLRPGAHHFGVFERFASWTVIEAGASGPIVARHVLRAWFVGTFNGG